MAIRKEHYSVGDVVYPAYEPKKVGKVVEIMSKQPDLGRSLEDIIMNNEILPGSIRLKVKRPNGDVYVVAEHICNDYEGLVAETERKLNTHKEILKKAKAV